MERSCPDFQMGWAFPPNDRTGGNNFTYRGGRLQRLHLLTRNVEIFGVEVNRHGLSASVAIKRRIRAERATCSAGRRANEEFDVGRRKLCDVKPTSAAITSNR